METSPSLAVASEAKELVIKEQRKHQRRSKSPFLPKSNRVTRSKGKTTQAKAIRQPKVSDSPIRAGYSEGFSQLPDDQSALVRKRIRRKTTPKRRGPTESLFFKVALPKLQLQDSFWSEGNTYGLAFQLRPSSAVGLIQERICDNLFALVVQAMLWNKTRGVVARPVLVKLLSTYPNPKDLAVANEEALVEMIRCLGLQYQRSQQLINMAATWIRAPPRPDVVLQKKTLKPCKKGWEISHLPGIGRYAEDSFRIFGRDQLRGVDMTTSSFEPEWKRVTPLDKDLRRYVSWRWAQEGYEYDYESGFHWEKGSVMPDDHRDVASP